MKKKIIVILGSPRKNGNTAALAEALANAAVENGADVETVYLAGLDISPCRGCNHCQKETSPGCIIKDDMTPLYKKLEESDAIVFASPVYWFNLSAQLKTFIDRLYAVGVDEKNIFRDKNMAALMCFADDNPFDSGAVNALRSLQDMFNYLGAVNAGMVYGSAADPGDIEKNEDVIKKAAALGKKLASLK
ncbi:MULTISPECIES: flavodoxin family protein [unclassified Oceanispirochaeta]|uniref:flavodoxin family protein n=1 Tax=unclassified Oceanispirochaeta TaxID=2635722 RepID=UPI000E09B47D|nr:MULTISPECIES: flavodoxin family protein [unclassified Oceanispirochaeta]MBF9018185.1 flavodoxin family protein [Oceanispirochaeta sp. M2]NPD74632.1 flavodoxin family protein [Oceanispirochaeta sp. M1]RDG29502.1 flavodoxin family protein [Oceanispirochaeta sp. M1]